VRACVCYEAIYWIVCVPQQNEFHDSVARWPPVDPMGFATSSQEIREYVYVMATWKFANFLINGMMFR
jgi:hypothetical protein